MPAVSGESPILTKFLKRQKLALTSDDEPAPKNHHLSPDSTGENLKTSNNPTNFDMVHKFSKKSENVSKFSVESLISPSTSQQTEPKISSPDTSPKQNPQHVLAQDFLAPKFSWHNNSSGTSLFDMVDKISMAIPAHHQLTSSDIGPSMQPAAFLRQAMILAPTAAPPCGVPFPQLTWLPGDERDSPCKKFTLLFYSLCKL